MTEAVPKKGVFEFLKGLVAEEVPDPPAPERGAPAPVAANAVRTQADAHAPDPQALSKLEARLHAACPPAYLAFIEQYDALKDVIPDEITRFKAALKTGRTTADKVLAALDQLLRTMDAARSEFSGTFDENKAKRVAEAEQSVRASEDLIKSSEDQIRAIQERIASLRTKSETDVANMQNEMARLEGIRGGFEAALAQVVGRLSSFKNRLAAMPKV